MKTHKNMTNLEVAGLLRAAAAAYEVKGDDRFRVAAYDKAADSVEHATSEVKDLWDDDKLSELPGIGANIASHLDELFRTGKVKHFDHVFKKLPPAMFELLDVPGVGAKTAYKLTKTLGIKSARGAKKKLLQAAKEGKIALIEGFGEESEKAIIEGLEEFARREDRMPLHQAQVLADKVAEYMKKERAVLKIEPLGSLRRMVATVGDIDFAVATREPKKVVEHFVRFPEAKEVVASGQNTARIIHRSGAQIDLKTMRPEAYGALLQHFTGSKHHNIHLRELAQSRALSLSEYGIKDKGKTRQFASEEEFYRFLKLPWIPPELREDAGEIEAAQESKLPRLVEVEDIKGEFHVHTSFDIETSHDLGADSIEKMAKKALKLGYDYLGLADHNPSLSGHSQSRMLDLLKKRKEAIKRVENKIKKSKDVRGIKLLNGLEIDIRPDGTLSVPNECITELDFAIVSVHSSFKMSRQDMTRRVLAGLDHPKVKILGHPTGRLLGKREGFELDWEKVFDFCLSKEKWLEIDAYPLRLDLPDTLVREAVKKRVKMVIDTDAHSADQMEMMRYGVSVARRGWAEKDDIVNTLPVGKVVAILGLN